MYVQFFYEEKVERQTYNHRPVVPELFLQSLAYVSLPKPGPGGERGINIYFTVCEALRSLFEFVEEVHDVE